MLPHPTTPSMMMMVDPTASYVLLLPKLENTNTTVLTSQIKMSSKKNRIAFGSCNDQDQKNNLWNVIHQRQPAAFIWGGDAIYADTHGPKDWSTIPPKSELICSTPDNLRQLYKKQRSNIDYNQLIQQENITIFGTYDDHDYGCNNADRTYEHRYESSLAYVDFLGLPSDAPMRRRAQNGHGVYGVKLFDFSNADGTSYEVPDMEARIDADLSEEDDWARYSTYHHSNRTVAVFVLDVRTNKSPWKQGPAAYLPDYDGDFLGEHQWEWLQNSVRRSQASVNVFVSGLQYHGNRYHDANIAEAWGKFPLSQQRFYDTVLQDHVHSPILISGDVHMTQLSRKDCMKRSSSNDSDNHRTATSRRRRPLVEFTTSGMTHSWGAIATPVDDNDTTPFKPSLIEIFQSFLARNFVHAMHRFCPWTDIMISSSNNVNTGRSSIDGNDDSHAASSSSLFENGGGEGSKQGMQYALDMNFGELEFDWNERTVTIRAIGENGASSFDDNDDHKNHPLLMAKLSMDQLSGITELPDQHFVTESDFRTLEEQESTLLSRREWICINHRGIDRPMDHALGHLTTVAAVGLPFCVAPIVLIGFLLLTIVRRLCPNNKKQQRFVGSSSSKTSSLQIRFTIE